MTDAELIARLREYREINEGSTGVSYDPIPECLAAADRIEALIAERDEYHNEAMTYIEKWGAARKAQGEAEAKLAKAHKDGSQLAAWQCLFDDGKTGIVCDDWGNQYCAMQRRAERAEAALATAFGDGLRTAISVIASIGYGKNKDVDAGHEEALRAVEKYLTDWTSRSQPHDRTALDRHDAKTREKALREAAQAVAWHSVAAGAILALIEKPQCV